MTPFSERQLSPLDLSWPTEKALMDTVYAVTTNGNIEGLCLSLQSVAMQETRPHSILVRWEGDGAPFNNYYFSQVCTLARQKGIAVTVGLAKSKGIRAARQALLTYAASMNMMLWMGDDDVVYSPHCLGFLAEGLDFDTYYVVGNKPDLTNSRGYPDFDTSVRNSQDAKDNDSYNSFYCGPNKIVNVDTCDTGNVLINAPLCVKSGITFEPFKENTNSGGEDTLFAVQCIAKNPKGGKFATRADSYHLEKPSVRFGEFAARKQLVMREAQLMGLSPETTKNMMPGVKVFKEV